MRVAVAGCGFIATKKHLPALRRLPGAELVAVADRNGRTAREVAGRFGVPAAYEDVSDMLRHARPELVHVCTPPRTHAEVAMEAIRRGCHVLIEKPMAVSLEECDAIIAASSDAGVKVCVAHSDLFYPPFIGARRLTEQGRIGRFTGMRIFLSTPTSYMTSVEGHWAHELPGGVIGETGPHAVYMTLPFINPIRDVRVHASKRLPYAWSRFDDYRIDLIGDEAVCSVTSVYTSNQWAAQLELWGTDGMLKLDLELMSIAAQGRESLNRPAVARSGLRESVAILRGVLEAGIKVAAGRYSNTHDILIGRFFRAIETDASPPVSPEEGREAVRVMDLLVSALDRL